VNLAANLNDSRDLVNGIQARLAIRSGVWTGHTAGIAKGYVQGNLVVLPEALAADFLLYCQRNPKPCPLLAVGNPGGFTLPSLATDLDLRTDLPRYRLWRDGELVDEPSNIQAIWQNDFVAFVIGCSFSFEQALLEAGVPLRHVENGRNVAMYKSSFATQKAGPFEGPMVVSMRPLKAADVIRAVQITSRFPTVHGAPVHIGDPSLIGIKDLQRPDFGDPVTVADDELPVFWACGVTPQAAVAAARPKICITHSPGFMLVTDLLNHQLAIF
jgi:uncharacterized protein YcsI (UPF0317 family)